MMAASKSKSGKISPKTAKKAAKKSTAKAATARRAPPKGAKAAPPARKPAKASRKSAEPMRKIRHGLVSHTEFASADPPATKLWCERVLGWKFLPPVPVPTGQYHMWRDDFELGGGGIRDNNHPEPPGTVPYIEVNDIERVYDEALAAGAVPMMAPSQVGDGGWIAVVMAPGNIQIGFYGRKD